MIIDATNTIMGRLAAYAAKKALEGETVDIVNAEKAIITGKKNEILNHYLHKRGRGGPFHGPYIPRKSNMLLKRVIRGMLPHKKARGRDALKRIMCYNGIPEKLNEKKFHVLENANIKKLKTANYLTLNELSKYLGAKQ